MAYIGNLPVVTGATSTNLEVTTQGGYFSNYNEITSDQTITTSLVKNIVLIGDLSVTSNAILTIAGSGEFRII